ncbi:AAA family ATPase [Metallosphaera javensis (ex Sakai et al. 2022)]|uniref:AAA family ATPase n=1 Tax=Metallosphaera javensis (ex Sakai et al. 2022) TaxID=2775498 RepID=UPI002587C246|nr:MAG: ATPase [Metallosphaera javensis (ex Sakai et al. 2022)]
MEIQRREYKDVMNLRDWTLMFGRRKVGKSYLIRKYLKHDLYFTVTRDLQAFYPDGEIRPLRDALRELGETLRREGTVVVDEFQRMPERYWEVFGSLSQHGKLVLVGSSFRISKKVFDSRSPLLGFVMPFRLGLIHYAEALHAVRDPLLALLYKDPWVIPFVRDVREVQDRGYQLYMVTKGLVGEIFEEEERQLTTLYEAILMSLAEGEWNTSVIAGSLAGKGLDVTASSVSGYLDVLASLGLVEKIEIFGPKRRARWYYRLSSPILSLMFYAEAKYNVSVTESVGELPLGREVQFAVGELLAEKHGGIMAYSPHEDIDVVILRDGRPVIGYEVKMGELDRREAERAVSRIRNAGIPRVGLVSLRDRPGSDADESLGPEELRQIADEISVRVLQ